MAGIVEIEEQSDSGPGTRYAVTAAVVVTVRRLFPAASKDIGSLAVAAAAASGTTRANTKTRWQREKERGWVLPEGWLAGRSQQREVLRGSWFRRCAQIPRMQAEEVYCRQGQGPTPCRYPQLWVGR